MWCIFAKYLTIYTRRHFLINIKSANLEKTWSNTLITLFGRAMYAWTQVKYRKSPSSQHQHAPNISSSFGVCETATITLFTIMLSSQRCYQSYYIKIKHGYGPMYRRKHLLH